MTDSKMTVMEKQILRRQDKLARYKEITAQVTSQAEGMDKETLIQELCLAHISLDEWRDSNRNLYLTKRAQRGELRRLNTAMSARAALCHRYLERLSDLWGKYAALKAHTCMNEDVPMEKVVDDHAEEDVGEYQTE